MSTNKGRKRTLSESEDTPSNDRQSTNHNKRRRVETLLDSDELDVKQNEPITLNVGGKKHRTTKSTLSASSNSVLSKMFEGNVSVKPAKDGSYFIDRDGKHFRYILNFLRDGTVNISDNSIINELLQEAQYYQIPSLIDTLLIKQIAFNTKSEILSEHHIEQISKYQMRHHNNKVPKAWKLLTSLSTSCNDEGVRGSVCKLLRQCM